MTFSAMAVFENQDKTKDERHDLKWRTICEAKKILV